MNKPVHSNLTRRERHVMDVLYRLGRATAGEVMKELPGGLSDSTVRTHLRILEGKGFVRHEEQGLRFVYSPAEPRKVIRRSVLRHLIDTFYDGSTEKVIAALIGSEGSRLSSEELRRIAELVEKAQKKEGKA